MACGECPSSKDLVQVRSLRYAERPQVYAARRRARFCRRRLTAGAPHRATRLALRRGFHDHRGRPRGLQFWPGGGCRCAWGPSGTDFAKLKNHVRTTHATSHFGPSSNRVQVGRQANASSRVAAARTAPWEHLWKLATARRGRTGKLRLERKTFGFSGADRLQGKRPQKCGPRPSVCCLGAPPGVRGEAHVIHNDTRDTLCITVLKCDTHVIHFVSP